MLKKTFHTFIAILLITTHTSGAILKYRTGHTTSVVITDTAAVYDTLACTITIAEKNGSGTQEIYKKKIDYLVIGNDTLEGERLQCTSFSSENAIALLGRNNDHCRLSYAAGEAAGKQYQVGQWQVAGTVVGCLTGIAGAGMMYGLARTSHPDPRVIPDTVQVDCFRYGYENAAKKKTARTAWRYGLFGMALTISMLLIISGNTEYDSYYHGQAFSTP